MRRMFAAVFCAGLLISLCLAQAIQPGKEKIRVGYFAFSSFQEVDSTGHYSGYGYDYLQEIAQYTGWDYEFVFATWEECLEMLAQGEIDLLGSAQFTEERNQVFDFPKLDSGISYAVLCASSNDQELAYEDFEAFNGMTVGLLKGNSRNGALESYCVENGFTVKTRMFENQDDLLNALHTGHVDTILTSNLRKDDHERIVARFAPSSFYFVTTKGNQAVLEKLNYAQTQIKLANPYYDSELYQKYYGVEKSDIPVFTRAERTFIQESPQIRVSYDPAWGPVESQNAQTGEFEGIVEDVFRQLEENTGLTFTYVPASDMTVAGQMLQDGQVELISAVDQDYEFPGEVGVMRTNPFVTAANVIVTDPMQTKEGEEKIGVTTDFANALRCWADAEKTPLQIYSTTEDCFAALKAGEISAVYANVYVADHLRSDYRFSRFQTTSLPSMKDELCIAVSRDCDPRLLSILNKAVFYLAEDELQDIILNNTTISRALTLQDYIYQNPIGVIALSSSVLLIVIAFLIYVTFLRSRTNKQVFQLLYKDDLTGIWNFNYFLQQLKHVLATDKKTQYAMVYADVERFKDFNEAYGYEEGDRVLKTVAQVLKESLEPDEPFARVSNDNFVALLRCTEESALVSRLTRFHEKLGHISKNDHDSYRLLFTSGIYIIKDTDHDVAHIVDCANDARKTIKGNHKSTYAFFSDQLQRALLAQREIESMMEPALAQGQFVAFYQPKVDLKTSKIVGAEALVRWQHPQRGLVPPDSFVPLFEKNGFIVEMDFYIFECVCKTIRDQLDAGLEPVIISSNFSRVHFNRPGFLMRLRSVAEQYQVPHNLLELEVTESMLDENPEIFLNLIGELQLCGFRVAMDDFGSGYSSLNLLKSMPIDTLKLDKEFLQKGIMSEKDRIIIEGFVDIAQKLKIEVVCEGVETQEQVSFLRSIGCDVAQGYLYARPLPLPAFESMLYG